MRGVITAVVHSRGFAFVRGDEDHVSRFLHAKWVEPPIDFDTLFVGQPVEFKPDDNGIGGNRQRAMNVRKLA